MRQAFENNPYVIDYVRVYQKDSYNEDVKRPVKKVTLRNPDANGTISIMEIFYLRKEESFRTEKN
mgnify:CR=1 FL=1